MKPRNTVPVEAMRELADAGLNRSAMARRLGCSRQTIWRRLGDYEPKVTPLGASNGAPPPSGLDALDWPALQVEAVDILRTSAHRGSATSAVQLARLASSEARADSCADHVDADLAGAAMLLFHDTLRALLTGRFARRISLAFEIDPAIVEEAILSGLDDIARELNAREECVAIVEEQRAAKR